MKKRALILTHRNPDMDAIASAFILKDALLENGFKRVDIDFISIHENVYSKSTDQYTTIFATDITPKFPVDIVLDHHNKKDLAEEITATDKVVEYIEQEFDIYPGYYEKVREIVHLLDYAKQGAVPTAYRTVLDALYYIKDDHERFEFISKIVYGIILRAKEYVAAEGTMIDLIESGKAGAINRNYKVVYIDAELETSINGWIFKEMNADVIAFKNGNNIGLLRNAEKYQPDLRQIKEVVEHVAPEELDEWFFHPIGFIAARGTKKHPIDTPSKMDLYGLAVVAANLK